MHGSRPFKREGGRSSISVNNIGECIGLLHALGQCFSKWSPGTPRVPGGGVLEGAQQSCGIIEFHSNSIHILTSSVYLNEYKTLNLSYYS